MKAISKDEQKSVNGGGALITVGRRLNGNAGTTGGPVIMTF